MLKEMGSYKLFEWRMNRCSSACLLSVLRWGPLPPPPLLKGGAHLQSSIALYREVMVVGVLLLRQSGESTTPTRVRMPVLTGLFVDGLVSCVSWPASWGRYSRWRGVPGPAKGLALPRPCVMVWNHTDHDDGMLG